MFNVRYENENNNVELTFTYGNNSTKQRDFTLNRKLDEQLSKTFEKLVTNVDKHLNSNLKKKPKNGQPVELLVSKVSLYDLNDHLVSNDTTNGDAWKENYKLVLNEETFKVAIDLPFVKKITLSELLIVGLPTIAYVDDQDHETTKNFLFQWFYGDSNTASKDERLICEGLNKKMCVIPDICAGKFIKLVCTPSDGNGRKGIPYTVISQNPVQNTIDLNKLPMTRRHLVTKEKLTGNDFRVVTYNILANAYRKSTESSLRLYPHCPVEYMDFKYRRMLLIHELLNYNADIVFLQECDEEFFNVDLKSGFYEQNYSCYMKSKGHIREGEAILFRNDRFRILSNHDIRISEQIKTDPFFENFWKVLTEKDENLKQTIEDRTTPLQVLLVESIDNPGNCFLLANTHLYYEANADYTRLIQAIVSIKYLENLIDDLKTKGKENVHLLFGGDFNALPTSLAFSYITTQKLPLQRLKIDDRNLIVQFKSTFSHNMSLSVFTKLDYTVYVPFFNGILDYIFYDSKKFEINRVIPMPTHREVVENKGLPSKTIPSDHIAVVIDFKLKD